MVRVTAGGDDDSDGATAICAGEAFDSKLITVVGFVLASEFWRDWMSPSSDVYDAPTDEPRVSRRCTETGGGVVVRTCLVAESDRHNGAEPDGAEPAREMTEVDVGDGGMGRTLASSSATRPASRNELLVPLASSAIEIRGPLVAISDSDAMDGVREREKTLNDGGLDPPESMVEAG